MDTTTDTEIIQNAIDSEMGLEIDYTKADGTDTTRQIMPVVIEETSKGELIVRTWDFGREAVRSYRIDRLNQVDAEMFALTDKATEDELAQIRTLFPNA